MTSGVIQDALGADAAIQRGPAPTADPFALRRIVVSGRDRPDARLTMLRRARSG